ncbi:hypothetical protein ACTL6P_17790 [Endozoicomonas acroporae]|uniref:integrase n=1 Tax=Endozoicomonas acroporae TaxID=1701104 RepID=UPI000C76D7E5|nr:integrase [Endozoicomonas acroporae]
MNNVFQSPKVGVDHVGNLKIRIEHYQKFCPFDVEWSDFIWDVTDSCPSHSNKAHTKSFLYFSRDNGKRAKAKSAVADMKPFHNESLAEIAKCHICDLQIQKVKTVGYLQSIINAYRFVDLALLGNQLGVDGLTNNVFVKAEKLSIDKLENSTAYWGGSRLSGISQFIDKYRLTPVKTKFNSTLKRQDTQVPSDTKIDLENSTISHKKMPDTEVLKAIGLLSSEGLDGDDGLFLAITEIIFATGLRFDEVITLSTDFLYEVEEEEYNEITGDYDTISYWEIKYYGKKKGHWRTKVIPDVLVPILKKGFDFILEYLAPVRTVLEEIEESGGYNFFPSISGVCFIGDENIYKLLGSSNSNATSRLKKLNVTIEERKREVPVEGKANVANSFIASELKDITSDKAAKSAKDLWTKLKSKTTATSLSRMLLITQHQRHHDKKKTNYWSFCTITDTQYRDFITGRDTMDDVNSIFQRRNIIVDGINFRITSHQFRHYLNTICRLGGNISELEIARYFGRAYMGDNQAYDHSNKAKMVMDKADDILAANNITKEQAVDAMTIFNLVDSEEALDAMQNMATSQVSSIGLCQHDFNDSPCGKHYACLRFCANYKRIKGEQSEIDELIRIKEQQEQHIEEAKEAVAEEYWGANNWLHSHQELLDGCIAALAIEDDDSIPEGSVIQVFPEGKDKCEAIQ